MSYTQSSRNISLSNDWILHAECKCNDGSWRTSTLDLNKCVGLKSALYADSGEGLEIITGLKANTLRDSHGQIQNVRLEQGGRILKGEFAKRVTLFNNFFKSFTGEKDWQWSEINLDDHIRNVDGMLECFKKIEDDLRFLPDWMKTVVRDPTYQKIVRGLSRAVRNRGMDDFQKDMAKLGDYIEDNARIGAEYEEKQWQKGSYVLDGYFIRPGT